MERIVIARGILSWPRSERQTDRYGSLIFDQRWVQPDARDPFKEPDDGRDTDWMDPEQLYRAIHQTVELEFRPA